MAVEMRGQLLARERELDGREGAVTAREDGLATGGF
jgi:tetrahydromethanopterin S-methyltransferase subunit F